MGMLVQTLLVLCISGYSYSQDWYEQKYYHRPSELDSQTYQALATGGNSVSFETIVNPLLIPRVPGTENHVAVRNYISEFMANLGWNVEKDTFEDTTPLGVKPFENIITTLDPNVPRRLVLACHFDSKYTREYAFVGATDSAVPCAQLMHLAATMKTMLDSHKSSPQNVTLQFIFFDGEEAFQYWTATDSLYGSRHLAAKWEATPYPPGNTNRTNELHRMDMMVLLDLLGTSNIRLYSYFQETAHWYNTMLQSEQQLKRSNLWSGSTRTAIFQARTQFGGVEDDHIPFLQRGVNIMHLIPSPFPSVWHTERDNREALDFPTIDNLNKIFRLFTARYLNLTASS
ncbi:Glutaminyl-peptide cyclotransferase [Folsomia candida]|uniref:Glutaminyl-peptide cyclotransferase n=1 Tax=Folsomia candida TaxID=158441 RepID=A0A226EU19_FOLCA|nr:Glutaminyl-peptide cyclotransferase [Folsomia candida]